MSYGYAIELENVKKQFKVYYDKGKTIKEKVLFWKRNQAEIHQVLNGISFKVKKGEAVGLIGRNGCGKSTTLKLINKIMYPSSGNIRVNGRISSLIELGAGFHPDMTGRENIYTNASIFGMNKKEIEEKIDEIIEFSELGEYIDNPVRTYSSGMYMRLGFAIAINVKADILLIDEILAVGDVNFQKKCFEKLQEIKAEGVTIIIVSHSMAQIEAICDKVVWLEKGDIKECGEASIVSGLYNKAMEDERLKKEEDMSAELAEGGFSENAKRFGDAKIKYTKISFTESESKEEINMVKTNTPVDICLTYNNVSQVSEATDFRVCIVRNDGVLCYGLSSLNENVDKEFIANGRINIHLPKLELLPGKYRMDASINLLDGTILDCVNFAREFIVKPYDGYCGEMGVLSMKHEWRK